MQNQRPKLYFRGTPRPKVFPIGADSKQIDELRQGRVQEQITSTVFASQHKISRGMTIVQVNQPTHSNDRVYGTDGISPTLNTMQGGLRQPFVAIRNDGMEVEMSIANAVTPDAYLTSGKRKVVDGKSVLTSMFDRRIRRLTPLECERLMGLPDNWTNVEGMSDTQRYKQCGNGVVTNVVQAIVEKLL